MRGLLKNDFYAALSNCAVFAGVIALLGVVVTALANEAPTLLTRYAWMCSVGFSAILLESLGKGNCAKWAAYKLTMPVSKTDIAAGNYISAAIGIAAATVFAGIVVYLSVMLHGFFFDKNTDIINIFACGTGISLFMGAFFLPLSYLGGDQRREAFLFVSAMGAVGIFMGLVCMINVSFGPNMSELEIIIAAVILLACSLAAYVASFPLTLWILKRNK